MTSNVRWPVEEVLEYQRTRVGLWSRKDLIFTPFFSKLRFRWNSNLIPQKAKPTRSNTESISRKLINIDLPNDFLTQLDREATRRGITRQSLIKVWLYDRLHSSGQEAQSIVDLFGTLAKTQSIKKVGRLTKRAPSRPKS